MSDNLRLVITLVAMFFFAMAFLSSCLSVLANDSEFPYYIKIALYCFGISVLCGLVVSADHLQRVFDLWGDDDES